MSLEMTDPVKTAEKEVKHSTEQIEVALTHLKDKLDQGLNFSEKFIRATKNPLTLLGMALVTGIFLGQVARISRRNDLAKPLS
jgi:hypothetical protein